MNIPTTLDNRRDPVTHLKIEQAMVTRQTEGTYAAAQRLAAIGVPLDIARRVLATAMRRGAQPPLYFGPDWRSHHTVARANVSA